MAAYDRGWVPLNHSGLPEQVYNTCIAHGAPHGADDAGADGDDLPWYNSLPSARPAWSTSPLGLLIGVAMGTLLGAGLLLDRVLKFISSAALKQANLTTM